jgi:O-antigen/teichoic acid export membrane protein
MFAPLKRILNLVLDKNNDSLTKQIVHGSGYQFAANVVSRLGGLVFTIIVARILLPELFGLYNLSLSLILTVGTFADLGINTALSRYLSYSMSKKRGNVKEPRSRLRFLLNLKMIFALFISVIFFLLAPIIANSIFSRPEMVPIIRIGALYILAISIQGFLSTVFYPLKKVQHNLIGEIIFQAARILIFLLLTYTYMKTTTVFWALLIAYLISALYYLLILATKHRRLLFGKTMPIPKKSMTIFLGWAIVLNSALMLFTHIDIFMLGLFVKDEFIGYYSALSSLIMSIMALVVFGSVFTPIFTEIRDVYRLKRAFKKIMKLSTIISIPITIFLFIFLIPLTRLVYGSNYLPSQYLTPIVISSILLSFLLIEGIFTNVFSSFFTSKEKLKIPATLLIMMIILNFGLDYVFIKLALPFGSQWVLVAVSAATVLVRYINLFILIAFVKKEFRLLSKK